MLQASINPKERRVGFPCIHGYPVKCEGAERCDWCELIPQSISEYDRNLLSGALEPAMPGSEDE